MKYALLTLAAVLTLTTLAHAENKGDRVDSEYKPIVCPKVDPSSQESQERYVEATMRLIRRQTACWAARNVFEACKSGNTYALGDLTSSMISVCDRVIVKDKLVSKIYRATVKQCETKGQSRQDVAIYNACTREAAALFGQIVEVVKSRN